MLIFDPILKIIGELSPFYRLGKWGTEWLEYLPAQVTQLGGGEIGLKSQWAEPELFVLNLHSATFAQSCVVKAT